MASKLLAAAAALGLFAAAPVHAGAKYTFKLAHVITAGTPIDVAAHRFARLVKQRSNGEIEIKVFPAAQLGAERAIIEGVQLGTIEMSFTTTGAIGTVAPEFQLLDLPYLFPSYESAYIYLDGEHGSRLLALLDQKGIHGVVFLENGWRNFTSSKHALRRPEDLKGQKIRVMESPMYMGLIRTLNATPMPMAYSELPQALQHKVIDGQENPAVNVYSAGMFQSQPYMIKDRHTYNVFIFKVNGKLWRSLPEKLRQMLAQTAVEVRDFQRKLNREADEHFMRRLQDKGMKVYAPTRDDIKAWQDATAPLYDQAQKIVGGSWIADALRYRRDWDAGRHRAEEQRYVEAYRRIAVPVDEVMKNFN